ncbi:unnamed protein product [Litomosoides sigmodontis]|uniref:Uncharacterized protein n=1 Tax=Litomosoides sigmodontis TaxID=42156 RepID=A0A3P6V5A7_LITSI|nr:unnamed protein product [Litomosoides sigmodontis]
MMEMKTTEESDGKHSKSTSQNVEEKKMRYSQECERSGSSCKINDSTNDHVKLKRQDLPHRWGRFEKMIRRKKDELQHSVASTASGKFAANTLSKGENLNEMEFDITQWQNTLWAKEGIHENDRSKEIVDGGLKIDVNSPFANETTGDAFEEKIEKGNYLMRPGAISIGIDSIELVSFRMMS